MEHLDREWMMAASWWARFRPRREGGLDRQDDEGITFFCPAYLIFQ
ncbi:hypothetical protein [Lentzea sp. NPDC059081]